MKRLLSIAVLVALPCVSLAGDLNPSQKPTQKHTQKADSAQKASPAQKGESEAKGFWARLAQRRAARRACAKCNR